MFYPTADTGGVKTYILGKRDYLLNQTQHTHAAIGPERVRATITANPRQHLYHVKSPSLFWNPNYRLLWRYGPVKKALHDFQPDLVEIGSPYICPWLVRQAYTNHDNRPVLIGFYHADFPRADFQPTVGKYISPRLADTACRLGEWYVKQVYNRLDWCIVTNPSLKNRLTNLGVKQIEVLPFGVNTSIFRPRETQAWQSGGPLRLLYVGRLSMDKGILPFVDLIHHLRQSKLEVELTIIGDGYLREPLRQKINNAPYIHLLPFIHSKEVLARHYSSHDLLIVTTPHETFGIAALEAMACGTPVAAVKDEGGGIEALVNEQTGFILGSNPASFIPFLQKIDRQQLLAMRAGIRRRVVEQFDHEKAYQRVVRFYEQVVADAKAKRLFATPATRVSA